jgi:hypothetical protein
MLGGNTGSRHAHVNSFLLEGVYPNLSTSWNSLAVVASSTSTTARGYQQDRKITARVNVPSDKEYPVIGSIGCNSESRLSDTSFPTSLHSKV